MGVEEVSVFQRHLVSAFDIGVFEVGIAMGGAGDAFGHKRIGAANVVGFIGDGHVFYGLGKIGDGRVFGDGAIFEVSASSLFGDLQIGGLGERDVLVKIEVLVGKVHFDGKGCTGVLAEDGLEAEEYDLGHAAIHGVEVDVNGVIS